MCRRTHWCGLVYSGGDRLIINFSNQEQRGGGDLLMGISVHFKLLEGLTRSCKLYKLPLGQRDCTGGGREDEEQNHSSDDGGSDGGAGRPLTEGLAVQTHTIGSVAVGGRGRLLGLDAMLRFVCHLQGICERGVNQ